MEARYQMSKSLNFKIATGRLVPSHRGTFVAIVCSLLVHLAFAADQSASITKIEAKKMLIEEMGSDPDLRNDPALKELSICALDGPLDETFGTEKRLDAATYERRIRAAQARQKAGMGDQSPEVALRLVQCLLSSPAVLQAMKEKAKQDNPSATKQAPSLPLLDMDDLRLDIASLDGRKVRVKGIGLYMMDMLMLKKSMTDLSPIYINISKLAREQRRQIIQQCSNVMTGCAVTVQGAVGKVNYLNGILAENIEW